METTGGGGICRSMGHMYETRLPPESAASSSRETSRVAAAALKQGCAQQERPLEPRHQQKQERPLEPRHQQKGWPQLRELTAPLRSGSPPQPRPPHPRPPRFRPPHPRPPHPRPPHPPLAASALPRHSRSRSRAQARAPPPRPPCRLHARATRARRLITGGLGCHSGVIRVSLGCHQGVIRVSSGGY